MNEITLSGALQGEPELKFSGAGKAFCNFTVRVSEKAVAGQERKTSYFDCTVFGQLAENVAESLRGGDRVIVSGKLEQQKWEKDGEKRSKIAIVVWDVGADLRFVTVDVNRTERSDGTSEPALASF